MSIRAMAWAWEQDLPAITKIVLLALADHHNDETGQCNPTIKRIASKAGVEERTVERHMKVLVSNSLVGIEHNKRDDGSATSNQYYLSVGGVLNPPGNDHDAPPRTGNEQLPGSVSSEILSEISPETAAPDQKISNKPGHQEVMDWYQAELGYQIPNGGQEGAAVKWMLTQGYSLDEIQECYHHLKSQHFWADPKRLSLQTVKSEIGAWKKWKESGSPAPARASPVPPRKNPKEFYTPENVTASSRPRRQLTLENVTGQRR